MIRSFMYLRPGNLYKDFIIEENVDGVSSAGRPTTSYSAERGRSLRGALAEANEDTRLRWKQAQHQVTHTIVQNGRPRAKPDDKLVFGERTFYVVGVDEAGSLGIATIYYVEERMDAK